jgi:hypothetical protein
MANPLTVAGFADVLDRRFMEVATGEFEAEADFIPKFYEKKTPTQYTERVSALTPMGLYSEFSGSLSYDGPDQGYDTTATAKEYALAMQIERLLIEYDQFDIIDKKAKLLARSARQTRQVHAVRPFNNAFTVDTAFYNRSIGVALCSDSQTTTRSGVSTSTGFDNATTSALSPTALKAAYIQFRKFRDDAGQPLESHEANCLLVPVDLKDRAEEIVRTVKGIDSAEHTKNVLENRYRVEDEIRLSSATNWFLINDAMCKENMCWMDKVPVEFAKEEAFDEVIAKFRGYMVYHILVNDWRFVLGANA